MDTQARRRLSKFLSLVLRHQPELLGLELGEHGFVPLSEVLTAIQQRREWKGVTEEQIREVVASSDKQRFEISEGMIRARYGHSLAETIIYPEVEPPGLLYHGTSPGSLPSIFVEGLQPMSRQYVHLSTNPDQARAVGRRRSPKPVVLVVHANDAWRAGVRFYQPEERLYLATAIPSKFVQSPEAVQATADSRGTSGS
jgi:putative RNA 2'-phosphotransferase